MSAIALALVDSLMFFQLCDDATLHPDDALRMSESILATLDSGSDKEFSVLMEAVHRRLREERETLDRKEVVDFLSSFGRDWLPNL